MNFWEQFWPQFLGGIASGIVLALLGYLTRNRIVRMVRRSITRMEQMEDELRVK